MRRSSAWVAGTMAAAVAGLLVGGTTASGEDNPMWRPVSAAEYYAEGMTLEEISAASEGKPGEVIPPCPAAEIITQLKEAGLPSGPCDPFPESEPMILPLDDPEPAAASTEEICPAAYLRTFTPDHPTYIEAPCGPGAELTVVEPVAERTKEGNGCVEVTYRVAAELPEQTETVCLGDPRDPSRPYATNKVD